MSKRMQHNAARRRAPEVPEDGYTAGETVALVSGSAAGIVVVVGGLSWLLSVRDNVGHAMDVGAQHVTDFAWKVASHVPNFDQGMSNLAHAPAWQWGVVGVLTLVACISNGVQRLQAAAPAEASAHPSQTANEHLAERMFADQYAADLEAFAAQHREAGEPFDEARAA